MMTNWYAETFGGLLLDIDKSIRQFIAKHNAKAPIFWQQVYEHFDWSYPDPMKNIDPLAAGKRVRPLVMALVARSLCGEYEHVLPAGVALEIIHNFTLIHDDIMDNSDTRRGRPTLWTRYGIAQAIDTGDGLFALGMLSSLSLAEHVSAEKALGGTQRLMQACLDTVEGQALDIGFESRESVNADEYLTMIGLKTGRFIETATELGAYLSCDDSALIRHYADFGKNLGLAFQIWDDYLGIWGDPEIVGKSSTSDIEQKKKSYPITYALSHADEMQVKRLQAAYAKPKLDEQDVAAVMGVLDLANVQEKSKELVEAYFAKAMAALDAVNLGDNEDYQNLRSLAQFIVERNY
jgi:geranylgeranyl diphosphate synthase, type I